MRETWLSKELVVEPDLRVLQRHPRPLLFHLEQAHRSTLAHHVARPARLGPWVLINGSWYKPHYGWSTCASAGVAVWNGAANAEPSDYLAPYACLRRIAPIDPYYFAFSAELIRKLSRWPG